MSVPPIKKSQSVQNKTERKGTRVFAIYGNESSLFWLKRKRDGVSTPFEEWMRHGTMASSPRISPATWRDRSVSYRRFVVTKPKSWFYRIITTRRLDTNRLIMREQAAINETKHMHPLECNGTKAFNVNKFTFDLVLTSTGNPTTGPSRDRSFTSIW